ncbi:hypothetical protein H8K35_02880 [Undibacterium sp. LX40W]|uniref:Uncharacterized protein n=1 Tax=Undibacterium nitidum TaxID=2762298 RepID=A0A923HP42_9BURK|nr:MULTISPECIES: hypothetical protein [Undibacterium]MBC3880670.1 hypothetical protein [Undibacterium nitidum]MBC3890594.1 hypothetical protein [Undibacterium sp. LX40W]
MSDQEVQLIQEDRVWQAKEWTARVIKNEDDDGWAVAMYKDGQAEPALVGPWTMGRDKKNPKPLDHNAFNTLVKTASEFVRRHEQQLHATLNKNLIINGAEMDYKICLQIIPDEDEPYAYLSAFDLDGEQIAKIKVRPDFKLNQASAMKWMQQEFARID